MAKKFIWGSRRELYTGLKTLFFNAYDTTLQNSVASTIAMEVDSNSSEEAYPWLGGLPQVKEFLDERQIETLKAYDFSIKNKEWENTIGVKRTELEDDKLGQIKIRINGLAESVVFHREILTMSLLALGMGSTAAGKCFDGQQYFDTAHPITITNADGTKSVTTVSNKGTAPLTEDAIKTATIAMRKFTDDRGNRLNVNPTHLIVGPELQFTAFDIINRGDTYDANSRPNAFKGNLTLIVSAYVTQITAGKNPWYLFDCSRSIKPLIIQTRTPVEFNSLEGESESGFIRNQYLYGIYARYNVGFGLWQLAYGSDGTA